MKDGLMGLWAYGLIGLFCVLCSVSNASGGVDYYSPENILKFAEYLYQEGDYLRAAGEYQRYLLYSPKDVDAALYRLGLCYRLAGDTERAIRSFRKITTGYSASYQIAYSYFLSGQYQKSAQSLNLALGRQENADERKKLQILAAHNYLHQKRWHDADRVLNGLDLKGSELLLRISAQNGMRLPRKSPTLAGVLSTVVPGAGKVYCGQYGDGFYSLFLAAATGFLAWDGFSENGVDSIRGWIFGSIGAVFYAGNIYGSTVAARVHNHQLEVNLLRSLPAVPGE